MDNKRLIQDLLKQERDLVEALNNVRGLLKFYGVKNVGDEYDAEFDDPDGLFQKAKKDFMKDDTYRNKVIFILSRFGEKGLTSTEVARYLQRLEGLSHKESGTVARSHLSLLWKSKGVAREDTGFNNKKRYFLKKQSPN